mgnify:CR=1 FL=1
MEKLHSEHRERLPVSVSSAIFIEDGQGRLLLLQQAAESKGHKWGPPAGGMEAHEDPLIAARREAKEEIDVEIELINLLGIYTVDRGDSRTGIGFVFRGRIASGDITPKDGEIQDFRFFTPAEIQALIGEDAIYKPEYNLPGIQDWLDKKEYPIDVIQRIK